MQNSTVFKTNRLNIRNLQAADLLEFSNLHGDNDVMFYTETNGVDAETSLFDFNNIISKYADPENSFWVWAIETISNQEFVGICLMSDNDNFEMELGYRLNKKFWRLGLGGEVFNGLIDYAFEHKNASSVSAEADSFNVASLKIIEKKLNFVSEYYNTELNRLDFLYKLNKEDYLKSLSELV